MAMRSSAGHVFRLFTSLAYLRSLSSRKTVILLYHGVPRHSDNTAIDAAVFEQHILILKKEFRIVSHTELQTRRASCEPMRVMLTFDDGFHNHSEVVAPILRKYEVSATFFVCSRPSQPGRYLWFTYLRGLEHEFQDKSFYFRDNFFDMSPKKRHASVQQLKNILLNLQPHPQAMYEAIEKELPRLDEFVTEPRLADRYAGMTAEQLYSLGRDPLFSVGAHTLDHPFLSKCSRDEARRQILENKKWIEQITGRLCETIAYPSGDYNAEVLRDCEQIGLKNGHAVIPQLGTHTDFELPRLGIYSRSSDVLRIKAQWGNLIRALKIRLG
jgi:peptidoglycan/xylan/chitin deacetylase (PgdA/CDA1 family)